MSGQISYGGRYNPDNKHFQLYKKGIELGTWDPAELAKKLPIEKDKETWRNLNENEKEQWARTVAFFLDGEQSVAQDAQGLLEIVASPYLDHTNEKEAFMTTLALEEAKHAEFFAWYMNEVMDDIFYGLGKGPRRENFELPRLSACGASDLFERQGQLIARAKSNSADPVDIARAMAIYHVNAEGILARAGYTTKNLIMAEAPLPALEQGFQLISTDEGRHITNGVEILKELLEKERAGEPAYQGVDAAIWDQALLDLPDILDTGFFIFEGTGDPLHGGWDTAVDRVAEIATSLLHEQLDLDSFDGEVLEQEVGNILRNCNQKLENNVYEDELKKYVERYTESSAQLAADGGDK
jgi:ribonucleoside-diphosphate reductase beta chain